MTRAYTIVFLLLSSGALGAQAPVPLASLAPYTRTALAQTARGAHGGRVVHHRGRSVEIHASQAQRLLDAYVPRSEGAPPQSMTVTLYRDEKTGREVRLKAVGPTEDGYYHYQSEPVPGALALDEGSAVALGVQFDLENEGQPLTPVSPGKTQR